MKGGRHFILFGRSSDRDARTIAEDLQDHGKVAVLTGSLLAAVLATVLLRFRTAARDRRSDRDSGSRPG